MLGIVHPFMGFTTNYDKGRLGKMGISWDIILWGYHEIGCNDYIYDLTHKHEDLAGQKC